MDNLKKLTEAEYRSAPGLNYSTLKKIEVSPLHFVHARDEPQQGALCMLQYLNRKFSIANSL
jgi:hypothetical protein